MTFGLAPFHIGVPILCQYYLVRKGFTRRGYRLISSDTVTVTNQGVDVAGGEEQSDEDEGDEGGGVNGDEEDEQGGGEGPAE